MKTARYEASCDTWEAEAGRLELERDSSEYWALGSAKNHRAALDAQAADIEKPR
jgi:hypothetical protein